MIYQLLVNGQHVSYCMAPTATLAVREGLLPIADALPDDGKEYYGEARLLFWDDSIPPHVIYLKGLRSEDQGA